MCIGKPSTARPRAWIIAITSPTPILRLCIYAALLISVVVADSSVYDIAESHFRSFVIVALMITSAAIPNSVNPVITIPHAISIVLTYPLWFD